MSYVQSQAVSETANKTLNYLLWTIVVGMAAVLLSSIIDFSSTPFWRHDSVYYLPSYFYKLPEEGRWINLLAFPILKLVHPVVALFASYTLLFIFFYQSLIVYLRHSSYTAMVSLTLLSLPLWSAQLEWPATTLPGFLILAFCPWLYRKLNPYSFYAICSVLFFGTFSNLYFLLAIFSLHKNSLRGSFKELALWSLMFPIGYFAAGIVSVMLSGRWVFPASWRAPSPATDIHQLMENLQKTFAALRRHGVYFIKISTLPILIAAAMCSVAFSQRAQRLIVFLSSSLALYITTLPVGINISYRTAAVSFTAITLLFICGKARNCCHLIISAAIVALLFIGFAKANSAHIDWYRQVSSSAHLVVQQGIKGIDPKTTDAIMTINQSLWDHWLRKVEIENKVSSSISEKISGFQYWRSLLRAQGFKQVTIHVEKDAWDQHQLETLRTASAADFGFKSEFSVATNTLKLEFRNLPKNE